jgi:hypothetical protein
VYFFFFGGGGRFPDWFSIPPRVDARSYLWVVTPFFTRSNVQCNGCIDTPISVCTKISGWESPEPGDKKRDSGCSGSRRMTTRCSLYLTVTFSFQLAHDSCSVRRCCCCRRREGIYTNEIGVDEARGEEREVERVLCATREPSTGCCEEPASACVEPVMLIAQ